jgi:nitrate reductase gamma subunit
MIGILLLNLRRWFVPRVRANTGTMRFATDALVLVVIVLGLAATIGYRWYVHQYELPGEFEYRDTIGAWFRSLFLFSPEAGLMVGAPPARERTRKTGKEPARVEQSRRVE